jgi:hypothetical protein
MWFWAAGRLGNTVDPSRLEFPLEWELCLGQIVRVTLGQLGQPDLRTQFITLMQPWREASQLLGTLCQRTGGLLPGLHFLLVAAFSWCFLM